ncbi:hypothetical protein U0X36_04885 [Bacillus thuringiensis]|uniref:hypothetical protein n=1 Tax=Bacillus thuringiensis TaxID=1428 RepID=UPI000E4CC00E|nr:hypothetical protein [Bacillus thuringiensis]MDZ3952288.1 hypothetical protein [Bacillus thuringiensis]RGP53429.1 hypothetical protein BTW32_09865 [Bacillus thuringiensis]
MNRETANKSEMVEELRLLKEAHMELIQQFVQVIDLLDTYDDFVTYKDLQSEWELFRKPNENMIQ